MCLYISLQDQYKSPFFPHFPAEEDKTLQKKNERDKSNGIRIIVLLSLILLQVISNFPSPKMQASYDRAWDGEAKKYICGVQLLISSRTSKS